MAHTESVSQASHRGAPAPVVTPTAVSPPSRRELASWWKKFRKVTDKEDEKGKPRHGSFVPGISGREIVRLSVP